MADEEGPQNSDSRESQQGEHRPLTILGEAKKHSERQIRITVDSEVAEFFKSNRKPRTGTLKYYSDEDGRGYLFVERGTGAWIKIRESYRHGSIPKTAKDQMEEKHQLNNVTIGFGYTNDSDTVSESKGRLYDCTPENNYHKGPEGESSLIGPNTDFLPMAIPRIPRSHRSTEAAKHQNFDREFTKGSIL